MSDPRYYHPFTPNRNGVCLQFMGRDQCREREDASVHNRHKGEPLTDVERRYWNDPIFHAVVHWMRHQLQYQEWSLQDLRDAVYVVERLEAERRDRHETTPPDLSRG
jgi:hypothetical protein